MELIFPAVFTALLLGCAYYDWKIRKVPDLLTAALWCSFVVLFYLGNWMEVVRLYALAGAGFATLYSMNAVMVATGKPFFLSWADVLGVPPYVAAMALLSAPPLAVILPIIASFLVSGLLKNKTPLFPFLAAAFIFYFAMNVAM